MAWWLAYEELYGDMDEAYPIMTKKDDDVVVLGEDTLNVSYPVSTASSDTINLDFGDTTLAADTVAIGSGLFGGLGTDHISFDYVGASSTASAYHDPHYYATDFGDVSFSGIAGTQFDDPKYYATKPKPDLKYKSQKYQEDKGIADLKDYVASTYKGHYTNENSDVQTLDLIHSVGDAESFCRSNALKYLSRYDKKGSAKNDILKAMHYCLLLYYFSGNTQEPDYTNTRYETI